MMVKQLSARRLDLDVDARRQTQLVQGLDRLGCGLHDVDQPLVRADLELLLAFLSIVGPERTVYRSIRVGSGIGPCTSEWVRFAVSTIS